MSKRLLAIVLVLAAMLASLPASATLMVFRDRGDWQAAAGGGQPDWSEGFDTFTAETRYGLVPLPAGPFLGLRHTGLVADDPSFSIVPAPIFQQVPSVNGSAFAIAGSQGSAHTVLEFAPVVALGFDYGKSGAGVNGEVTLETSRLTDNQASFTTSADAGGFIGLLYDGGETFESLSWVGEALRFSGIDNVEAYTSLTPVPLPSAGGLFGVAFLLLSGLRSLNRLGSRRSRRTPKCR